MVFLPHSDEWHTDRMQGIGGSDAAAVMGFSKHKTPYQVYIEKIGATDPEPETWEMARGKALEPLLRQYYADTTGRNVLVPKQAMVHPKYPFMRYNPDGLTNDGRLQEFKTAAYGDEWGEEGSDEIPTEYILQIQHGLAVTRRRVADCVVSINGDRPRFYIVEADRELQEIIIEREAKFWELVITRTLPDPITNGDVARIYSRVNGKAIHITEETRTALDALKAVREQIKNFEAAKEELEIKIKAFMGENEFLISADDPENPIATWKQSKGAAKIDVDGLRLNHPRIAKKYTKTGAPSRMFLIK